MLLREVLRESGLRNLEREATFAIEHGRTRYALAGYGERAEYIRGKLVKKDVGAQIEGVFKRAFFEWTTDYGLHYGRPLLILVILIPVMAVSFYLGPLVIPQKTGHQHGIYRVLPKGRLVTTEGRDATADDEAVARLTVRLGRALLFALYFSLLSSFRIGWRDLNLGSWLTRLQFREYDLRGRGWARLVSGLQSLVSVYLLTMWALTYFGRPFQRVLARRWTAHPCHDRRRLRHLSDGPGPGHSNPQRARRRDSRPGRDAAVTIRLHGSKGGAVG